MIKDGKVIFHHDEATATIILWGAFESCIEKMKKHGFDEQTIEGGIKIFKNYIDNGCSDEIVGAFCSAKECLEKQDLSSCKGCEKSGTCEWYQIITRRE